MDHIKPNVGNVVFIGLTSAVFIVGGLAAMHYFSRRNVPLLSPAARGTADAVSYMTNTSNTKAA